VRGVGNPIHLGGFEEGGYQTPSQLCHHAPGSALGEGWKFWGTSTHVNGDYVLNRMRSRNVEGMRVFLCNIYVVENGGVARGGDGRVFRRLGLSVVIVHNPLRRQWSDNVRSLEHSNLCRSPGSGCRDNDKSRGTKFPLGHQRCCTWGGNPQKGGDDPSE